MTWRARHLDQLTISPPEILLLSHRHQRTPLQAGRESDHADFVQGRLRQRLLKTDIKAARGKALLVETVNAGWAEGKTAAPQSDWKQQRLGPAPTEAMVKLADAAFNRVLAASGCSPALFDDSDGTSKREALRQWHLGVVMPLARQLEYELTAKLETTVRLRFDLYNVDLAGRAQAFQKLVAGGVAVNEALATSGLLASD